MTTKYIVRREKFEDQWIHSVYETDGDVEIAVWEARNGREAYKYAEELNHAVALRTA